MSASRPGPQPGRGPGRPRDQHASEAALAAAESLLREGGPDAVTMTAVVARSGVPRATVYSRWRNRRALVEAALERAVAATLTTPRGDSPETVHEIARAAQEFLSLPSVRSLLPAIIGAARAGPSREPVGQCAVFDAYHGRVRSAYRLAAGDTVLPGDQDLPDLVADVVLGALVARALRTTSPPEDEATAQIVDIVIRGVRGGL